MIGKSTFAVIEGYNEALKERFVIYFYFQMVPQPGAPSNHFVIIHN